jgi:hypothetical protein
MLVRVSVFAVLAAGVLAIEPCLADPMTLSPEAARHFIAGKVFAFNCFDGTRGAGRIYEDGSVAGNVQINGNGPARYVTLPAGTLRVKGQSYCASVRGLPIEPCFKVDQTDPHSFRGSVSGLSFAYCDFTRGNSRPAPVRTTWKRPAAPLSLRPSVAAAEGGGD